MHHITLSELNALVRDAIRLTLEKRYWLVAEVSELRTAANGHCYMELVEKDEYGRGLRAKASAHVWRSAWPSLRARFERQTGETPSAGMKLLVQAEVDFHTLYGYSLNVINIDPAYTLGDMVRRRMEILLRLRNDGVLELNKSLPLPRPLVSIAVISSESAAGFGDFMKQIEASAYPFRIKLFPAVMQGERVETSIISALDRICAGEEDWDCVCILRGGGAASDLQGFDSYELASNVAQYPLPVLTGIGHERDDTVVDIVAHTRLKTPTAVAAFLIETRRAEMELLETLEARVHNGLHNRLRQERQRIELNARRLELGLVHFGSRKRERLMRLSARLDTATRNRLSKENERLRHVTGQLPRIIAARMEKEHTRLHLLGKRIQLASPQRILALGYSITTHQGRTVRNASTLQAGDVLETRLQSGTVRSKVMDSPPTDGTS